MRRARALPALAALTALAVATAQAGSLQVNVTDAEGRPVPDVVVLVEPAGAPAAPPAPPVVATVVQQGLRFQPFLTVVPVGSTVSFVNRDGYDHHVRSLPGGPLGATPPAQDFELRLDAADAAGAPRRAGGTVRVDVKLERPGAVALGCHLHSSMRGQLFVAATPWFAKTDAEGRARVDGVPDGAAQVTLWHPDQLREQAPLRATVSATPASVGGQLNFTPRRRRS